MSKKNLTSECSGFSVRRGSRRVCPSAEEPSGAVWGSWCSSAGAGPQRVSPAADVEEKDAAGSWLVFFKFSSLCGALYECFDIFQLQAVFQKLLVCEIGAAQHKQAACAVSQLAVAFTSAPKVKPLF